MSERGICPVCGREYALTKDGTMRYHWAPSEIRRYEGYDCKGYGQLPKSTVVDPIAAARRRGWDQAIAALRDRERLARWWDRQLWKDRAEDDWLTEGQQNTAADYLTAVRDTPAEGGTEHG